MVVVQDRHLTPANMLFRKELLMTALRTVTRANESPGLQRNHYRFNFLKLIRGAKS